MSSGAYHPEDQDRLLEEASAVVKEQAFYLAKAVEKDNTRDALRYASNMLCELRTSMLSPKNYYELYMLIFQEMQRLHSFFNEPSRHGRKMIDLYESVQHAGSILPRLYLLSTVGSAYIVSKEMPAKDILKDVSELCKGIQHPLRGLFLRYYLSQMLKDKVPDTGSEYEGEGGDVEDAFEFIFNNFNESNRLWVRIQHQGANKDKTKREKERHDLRVLVGANLVRMSQLEGMTQEFYASRALPTILEHIISVKDVMSQQYLLESMIQVFPDDFHIRTLETLLTSFARALPGVEMKPIVVTLMTRLARFLQDAEGDEIPDLPDIDVFSLFRTHLQDILERLLEPDALSPEVGPCLEIQAAFMQFTMSLFPDKVHYVDLILSSITKILKKYTHLTGQGKITGHGADEIVDLLACPLKSLGLGVLDMENYTVLMEYLTNETSKKVASAIVKVVAEEGHMMESVETVEALFKFIGPLVKEDTKNEQDKEQFVEEQQLVAKLPHQIRVESTDVEFQMLSALRGYFTRGGNKRMAITFPAVFTAALGLIPKIRADDARRMEEGEEDAPRAVSVKKVFQFLHKTCTDLQRIDPEVACKLWLIGAGAADLHDRLNNNPGMFEPICYEFFSQGLLCYEEDITETTRQFQTLSNLVGTIVGITCLEEENYDMISTKITQHSARLLKKPLSCRAIALCTHMYWCDAKRDGRLVLECLQKCLKVADGIVTSDATHVGLWVEMLDKYIYFYDSMVEDVNISFIQNLVNLCGEHIAYAEKDSVSEKEAAAARQHYQQTLNYMREQTGPENEEGNDSEQMPRPPLCSVLR